MDLALNNLQWLICYNTKPNQTKPINVIRNKILYFTPKSSAAAQDIWTLFIITFIIF